MTELRQRRHGLESFLASCQATDDGTVGVEIRVQPVIGHINLRGDPGNKKFVAATESALQQYLPVKPNTVSIGAHRNYWLGPDEWLIITQRTDSLIPKLRESLSGQHVSVTEVSGGQTTMQLSGPGARDVLAKGCTLDFHPETFGIGSCAQSGIARANVLIGLVDDRPEFEIVVRRSFAEYLALWLRHAAREYRVNFSIT